MFKWTNQSRAELDGHYGSSNGGPSVLRRSSSTASSRTSEQRASSGSSCSEGRRMQPPLPPRRNPTTCLSAGPGGSPHASPYMNVPLPAPPIAAAPVAPSHHSNAPATSAFAHCTCCCQHRPQQPPGYAQYAPQVHYSAQSRNSDNIYESLSPYLKQPSAESGRVQGREESRQRSREERRRSPIYENPPTSVPHSRSASVRLCAGAPGMPQVPGFLSPQLQRKADKPLMYNGLDEDGPGVYSPQQPSQPRTYAAGYATGVYCEIPSVPRPTLLRHHSDVSPRLTRPDSLFERLPLPPPELLQMDGSIHRNSPSPVLPLPPPPPPLRSEPQGGEVRSEARQQETRHSQPDRQIQRTAVVNPFRETRSVDPPPPCVPPPPPPALPLGPPALGSPAPPALPLGSFTGSSSPTDTLSSLATNSTGYSTYSSCSSKGPPSPRHMRKLSIDSTGSSGYQSFGCSSPAPKGGGAVSPADIIAQLSHLKSAPARKNSTSSGSGTTGGDSLQEELNKVKLKRTNRPVKEAAASPTSLRSRELEELQSRFKQQLQSKEPEPVVASPPATLNKPVSTPPPTLAKTRDVRPRETSPTRSFLPSSNLGAISKPQLRACSLSPRDDKKPEVTVDPELAQIQARIQRRLTEAEGAQTEISDKRTAEPTALEDEEAFPELPPSHMLALPDDMISSVTLTDNCSTSEYDLAELEVVADVAPIPANCPEWKRRLLEKKNQEKMEEAKKRLDVARAEIEKWKGVPEWKKKIILGKQRKSSSVKVNT